MTTDNDSALACYIEQIHGVMIVECGKYVMKSCLRVSDEYRRIELYKEYVVMWCKKMQSRVRVQIGIVSKIQTNTM